MEHALAVAHLSAAAHRHLVQLQFCGAGAAVGGVGGISAAPAAEVGAALRERDSTVGRSEALANTQENGMHTPAATAATDGMAPVR